VTPYRVTADTIVMSSWRRYDAAMTSSNPGLMVIVRRRRDLRLLLAANLVSQSGDWILGLGIAYSVYDLTGSTMASAGTLLAAFVPQVVLGPLAGVFVDRWDRRRTMIGSNLAMAAAVLPLLLVTGAEQVWLLYPLLVVQSMVEVFFAPAEQAFVPRLVDDDELVTANALNGQVGNLARLGGSALGGLAAAAGGIPAVAALDVATFLISAALLAAIRTSGRVAGPVDGDAGRQLVAIERKWQRFRSDLMGGVRMVRSSRALVLIVAFGILTSAGEGVMGALFAPFVNDVIDGSGRLYGLIMASQAIGGLVGGLVAATVGNRLSPVHLLGAGAVAFGAIDLAIFLYPLAYDAAWPAVVGMVLVGFPGALTMAGYVTLFQRVTHDTARGRAFSLIALFKTVALIIGTGIAGVLGERLGIVPVLAYQGVGYMLAGTMILLAWRPQHLSAPQDRVHRVGSTPSG
jgi:Na+/melibiose symporter-like transporter